MRQIRRDQRLTLIQANGYHARLPHRGAIAQLGERLHGMQEVGGSIPPGSTTLLERFKDFAPRPHRLEA